MGDKQATIPCARDCIQRPTAHSPDDLPAWLVPFCVLTWLSQLRDPLAWYSLQCAYVGRGSISHMMSSGHDH